MHVNVPHFSSKQLHRAFLSETLICPCISTCRFRYAWSQACVQNLEPNTKGWYSHSFLNALQHAGLRFLNINTLLIKLMSVETITLVTRQREKLRQCKGVRYFMTDIKEILRKQMLKMLFQTNFLCRIRQPFQETFLFHSI